MNMKNKIREFFTLTRKGKGGFTLVELIVVIAILGILAGVAVPVYNGYIKKADKAADEQLLAAINKAFASAVLAEGDDINDIDSATLRINGDKTLNTASLTPEDYKATFAEFYQGNETAKFKTYSDLVYDAEKRMFVGKDENAVIESLKQLIGNSSYNGNLEELTGDVGSLVSALGDFLNTESGKTQLLNSGFNDYLAGLGINAAEEEDTQKIANAAVLYLAKSAASMTDEDVYVTKGMMKAILEDYVDNEGATDIFTTALDNMAGTTKSGLASYAALYATAEAIALQQPGGKDSDAYKQLSSANPNNHTAVIAAVDNLFRTVGTDAISDYIGSEGDSQMSDDLDAYFQTLQAVNGKEAELKTQLESDKMFTTENATIRDLLDKLQN